MKKRHRKNRSALRRKPRSRRTASPKHIRVNGQLYKLATLEEKLQKHKKWLAKEPDGEQAQFRKKELKGADHLKESDLNGAIMPDGYPYHPRTNRLKDYL